MLESTPEVSGSTAQTPAGPENSKPVNISRRTLIRVTAGTVGAVAINAVLPEKVNAQGSLIPLPDSDKPPPHKKLADKEKQVPAINPKAPEFLHVTGIEDIPARNREQVRGAAAFAHNFVAPLSPEVKVEEHISLANRTLVEPIYINDHDSQKNIVMVTASLVVFYANTDIKSWDEVEKKAIVAALKLVNRGNDGYPASKFAQLYRNYIGKDLEDDQNGIVARVLRIPDGETAAVSQLKLNPPKKLEANWKQELENQISIVQENKYIQTYLVLRDNPDKLLSAVEKLPKGEAEAAANILLGSLKYTLDMANRPITPKELGFNEDNLAKLMKIGGNKINFALSQAE